MKKKIILLVILFCLILLTACSKSNTEVEDENSSYFITVTNAGSIDITDLIISMVGSDDIQQISLLPFGETTQNFEFVLPPPSDDNPISFGDYNFNYLQNGEELYFGITLPEINILVRIYDDDHTINTLTYHLITITNDSSYNVTEMEISMEGALGFHQINELIPGESSQEFEIHLIYYAGPTPDNYGYFGGLYHQNNQAHPYLFNPPSTNIIMHINNDDHTIEDVGN